MSRRSSSKLLTTGIVGTVVAAVCCFTPVLGVLLGAVGLSALLGFLDFVLIPALLAFFGITIFALVRRPNISSPPKSGSKES
ncbi:mercury resistance system transport protein MerF [Aliiroseovarius sp.]|uniref:mercury resistance system transport protein MerF n=1 Tax=Aliiroseovarius sp. TaxID=1872442 RepID=UPI00262D84E7|nr:mercury resistance system transport protein MerF [Aliiroseovarius sp.]